MLFILVFVSGILIVPLVLDSQKHPSDNIFRRAGRDVRHYQPVELAFKTIHTSSTRASNVAVGLFSLGLVVLGLYVGFWLLGFIGVLMGLVFK